MTQDKTEIEKQAEGAFQRLNDFFDNCDAEGLDRSGISHDWYLHLNQANAKLAKLQAKVQELESIINKKPEMFDFYQLYKKVEELKREVSHLEGVSDGYAVVEMEDKAKIKSLQSELSALKADVERLKEANKWFIGREGLIANLQEEIENLKKIKNIALRAENLDLKSAILAEKQDVARRAIEMARDGWVACREPSDRYVQYIKTPEQILAELNLSDKEQK